MSPPAAIAATRMGVSTSPDVRELKSFAALICSNSGVVGLGPNRINRLAVDFVRKSPNGSGWMFFLYIANAVQMSEVQKRSALANPDVARVISYVDQVGEDAVRNVIRERGY